ncbi:MAG TPA: UDP-N-acetylmuramoyl-L-alanine--D-glutamate ligase [Deltaproteobacteria bacterium]|nr:UDP-N-acetylmuramoyl-L-alanine--D-glutamate ligase [Deltaproteobacteria bacterium]HPP80167.1 UDP-N-acetylmuramoyl-L-alanine--D-glutamate ligase [Deltaproteobacteria bacterium]
MRVVVWGTGVTGLETARVMRARGHEVILVDESPPPRDVGMEVRPPTERDMAEADLVIPSPGVPRHHPLLAAAKRVLSEIEVASSMLRGTIVGVTGTNGKTTTTTLVHMILEAMGYDAGIGGNISPPLISLVDRDPDYLAVEISSFQLEWIENFRPKIAVCLNITPDHLDRYRSMEEYVHYKLRIFENQTADDIAVISGDDPYLKGLHLRPKTAVFSTLGAPEGDGAYVDGGRIVFTGSIAGGGPRVPPAEAVGSGVIEDMLAASIAGRYLGVDVDVMERVFMGFKVIHHRYERVDTIGGVTFVDDSKATNVGALDKALSTLGTPVTLILGGKDKGGDFSDIALRYRPLIRMAVVMGEAADRISREMGGIVPCVRARDMEEAVRLAYEASRPGDTVLLSPGCASFDMFNSYAHRGEVFRECVRGIRLHTSSR